LRTLCIIPARGGSKRIPRKNVRDFRGSPIIAWSIRAARDAACFDDIVVSTDDGEIAAVAESFGASVPFLRSEQTASDHATTADVLVETMERLQEQNLNYEAVCCLYATAAFTTAMDLREGFERLRSGPWNVVMPVTEFEYPIMRSLSMAPDGRLAMNWPQYRDTRSQDLAPVYHDAGQWYWFRPEELRRTRSLLGGETFGYVLPCHRVQDIDDEEDWIAAERKHALIYPNP